MSCPHCKSDCHIRYGYLHGRARRKCKDCGYQATLDYLPTGVRTSLPYLRRLERDRIFATIVGCSREQFEAAIAAGFSASAVASGLVRRRK